MPIMWYYFREIVDFQDRMVRLVDRVHLDVRVKKESA